LVIKIVTALFAFCLLALSCTEPTSTTVSNTLFEDTLPQIHNTPISPISTTATTLTKQLSSLPTAIDYDTALWTELTRLDDRLTVDLRYATSNNFVEEKMYDCPRCFLRPEAAEALQMVHSKLIASGYHIQLLDCYRPKSVQEILWAKMPDATYVTPPKKGSMHNRGYAVDVTLIDEQGDSLDMGSEFDFFGREAHHDYYGHDPEILARRKLLRETMAQFGFKHIRTEWWHYSYQGPYKSPFEIADFQWSCH